MYVYVGTWIYNLVSQSSFQGDRGHVIEKSVNKNTGDKEESQEFINIEEGWLHFFIFFYTEFLRLLRSKILKSMLLLR